MSIVALTVGFFAIQWNRGLYLGKSPEQIVAMGRSKWVEFHGKKKGMSSADMCEAESFYGDALKNLNDRALLKQSPARRKWLTQVRTTAKQFGMNAHNIGYFMTGGGTVWNLNDSTIHPDVEEVIANCISNRPMPAIKMKSFEALYKELDESVAKSEYLKPSSDLFDEEKASLLKKRMAELRTKQKMVETILANGKGNDPLRLRIFISNKITVASGIDLE